MNVWGLDKRRMIAMVVGVVVCAALRFVGAYAGFGLLIPSLLVAMIFGILFGPWVGLVSGGISYFAGPSDWIHWAGYALVGFIAGLAIISTRGHYRRWHEFAVAEVFGVVAMLISLALILYSNLLVVNSANHLKYLTGIFISFAIYNVVAALILVPL